MDRSFKSENRRTRCLFKTGYENCFFHPITKHTPLPLCTQRGNYNRESVQVTSLTSLSYAFIPYRIGNEIIPRPMLPVTLKRTSQTFPTMLLVDSGADYSMLQREIVQEALHIDISTLPEKGETSGVTGKAKIAWITVKYYLDRKTYSLKKTYRFRFP